MYPVRGNYTGDVISSWLPYSWYASLFNYNKWNDHNYYLQMLTSAKIQVKIKKKSYFLFRCVIPLKCLRCVRQAQCKMQNWKSRDINIKYASKWMTTEVINTNNYIDCINCRPPHRTAAKKLFIVGQNDILIGPNQMTFSLCFVFS